MKKIAGLAVLGLLLAVPCVAAPSGYFVGVEIVPHTFATATYGLPYLRVGYVADDIPVGSFKLRGVAYAALNEPLTPLNSWWAVRGAMGLAVTDNLVVYGIVSVWGLLKDFALTGGTWAFGPGVLYQVDQAFAVTLDFNFPRSLDPTVPFGGLWITAGLSVFFGGFDGAK
ncbi:MAG: hypothetical protein QXU79_00330 [Candidatus Micrarchaeaceae archaeon]